jgi:hypothetical protein
MKEDATTEARLKKARLPRSKIATKARSHEELQMQKI